MAELTRVDLNALNAALQNRCGLDYELGYAAGKAAGRKEQAEALAWYAEQAEALARYMIEKPPKTEAMMAVVTALALDAGKRGAIREAAK